ncbi:MAG TPA: NADH-quinone oxidoreductase subunit D, partial [Myxococcales bacterium]
MTEPDRRAEGATSASPGFSGTEPELEVEQDPLSVEQDLPTSPMIINLGPSHPAMHGTVRLVVTLDGETLVEAIPEIGFLHRGFSKSSENSTWHQVLPYTDRLNYVSPVLNNTGYIMGVEKLIGVKCTERAEYLRVLGGEIGRICDHLTCVGAIGLELGAYTVFLYAIEARELLWDRISELCGARVTVSWTRVGGVATDMPPGWEQRLRECLPRVLELTNEIDTLL